MKIQKNKTTNNSPPYEGELFVVYFIFWRVRIKKANTYLIIIIQQ